jgi:hypothetical protein
MRHSPSAVPICRDYDLMVVDLRRENSIVLSEIARCEDQPERLCDPIIGPIAPVDTYFDLKPIDALAD